MRWSYWIPMRWLNWGNRRKTALITEQKYTALVAVSNLSRCWIMDILQILYFLMDMRLVIRV